VTDAGPLIHLAEIDGLSLLTIFETLHLPKAVWLETVVKQRVSADDLSRLGNLQTHILLQAEVTQFCQRHSLTNLHTGETECFYLCSWLKVSTLLTDDLASVGCVPRTILNRRSNSPELVKRAELKKVRGTHPTCYACYRPYLRQIVPIILPVTLRCISQIVVLYLIVVTTTVTLL